MTDSDSRHLLAAQGFLELGLLADAFAELDEIPAEHRAHPDVLAVRWGVFQAAKKWSDAIDVARWLTLSAPDRFDGWWMLSFALHELKRTEEAYENLASVMDKFKGEHIAHYNLACYLAQLGRLDEARLSLKHAFVLNPKQRAVALEDPDLEPLWLELPRK